MSAWMSTIRVRRKTNCNAAWCLPLYLPDEGFGVRIEDMVVVTDDGCRAMTGRLPKEAEAIEAIMAA